MKDISFFIPLKNKNIEKVLRVVSEIKEICKTVNRTTMSNCYNSILEELSNSSISFDPYILGHPWEFRVLRSSKVVDECTIAWDIYLYDLQINHGIQKKEDKRTFMN